MRVLLYVLATVTWATVWPSESQAQTRYSPRLGINYQLLRYGNAYAARLTTNPVVGSPMLQPQIQLEQGDTITHLDGVPITSVAQLEQHHSQTAVTFINIRTGRAEARWVMLPPLAQAAEVVAPTSFRPATGQYSPRLGIYYQLVRYGNAYAARLTANPVAGSPMLQPQAQLEQGDTITHLDGVPITSAAQLEQHHSQTAVTFINIRTGLAEARWVVLPAQGIAGIPEPTSFRQPGSVAEPALELASELGEPVRRPSSVPTIPDYLVEDRE